MSLSVSMVVVVSMIILLILAVGYIVFSAVTRKVNAWHQLVNDDYRLINHNKEVLRENKRVLNRTELTAFSMKEYGLWLHDIHRDVLTVISGLEPADQGQLDHFNRVFNALQGTLHAIDDNFYQTFKLTPEEYRSDKLQVLYKYKDSDQRIKRRDNRIAN